MEKSCFNCRYFDQPSFEMKEFCWECLRQEEVYARWERKPITNAAHIRAMSDEELDKFLGDVQWDTANYCGGVTQKQEYPVPEQRGAWLDWLKREMEEGE